MSFNLLETVKNYFTSDFTNQSSSILGENVSGISKALTAILPTALAGILNKSTSGTEGANKVFETAKNSIENVSENAPLTSVDNRGKGSMMLNNFFGSAQTDLLGNISKYAAIKDSSTSALMSMALPPILGILGEHAEQNNFSASGLAGFLSSQKDHIMQAMPAGLTSNAALLGLGSIGSEAPSVASNVKSPEIKSPVEVHTISETPTAKWLVPLISILIVLALLFYFSKSCNQSKPSTATSTDSTAMLNSTTNAIIFIPIARAERCLI